jgi:hypothetical protein
MTEQKLLAGKVAEILGDYELAINIGRNSGVKRGMEFAVLGDKSINDPDSHKKLGTYKYEKVMVRVNQVEDNYSIASTMTTGAFEIGFPIPFSQPKLRSDISSATSVLDRSVSVGDVVEERRGVI